MTKALCQSSPRLLPTEITWPLATAGSHCSFWLGSQISMVTWMSPFRRPWKLGRVPPRIASVSYPYPCSTMNCAILFWTCALVQFRSEKTIVGLS